MVDNGNLCKELQDYKLNEFLAQKRRQQLRENNHELRQLEKHLQKALVCKQLREQRKNISHLKNEEFYKKLEENKKFSAQYEEIRNSLLQEEEQEKQKKGILLQVLKCQMNMFHQKRLNEFQDVKRDHDELERLIKQIEAEEIRHRKDAELIREKNRKEMEESYSNFKLKNQLEKKTHVDDMELYLNYQRKCDNDRSQIMAERKRIQKDKDELSELIGKQLVIEQQEKETRENLFLSLLEMERKAKDDQRLKKKLVKQVEESKKLRKEFENYLSEIQFHKAKQFKEEEDQFREERQRYLEERDKIDQLSDEKRRRKKMEHSRSLREMIEMRRCQKANDIAARITDFEKIINDRKKSDHLIEEERLLMLSSVPRELLRYLPAGVLKSSEKYFLNEHSL